jgi:exodeoxyribonuclease-3
VNSIRVRLHQLAAVIDKHHPAVIGLQETKVTDEDFPLEEINALGYDVAFHGQKTHYGVALLYKSEVSDVYKGFRDDTQESQKRFVCGSFKTSEGKTLTVMNGYFPQGENRDHPTKFPNKVQFYKDLNQHLNDLHSPDDLLFVVGDMNVAPIDEDIGIGDANMKRWLKDGKTSFLPEEREWIDQLNKWGLTDVYRHHYPTSTELFSWFDYRSRAFERDPKRGLRIDLIMASTAALPLNKDSGMDYDIRSMEKPSDHCPIWADMDITLAE